MFPPLVREVQCIVGRDSTGDTSDRSRDRFCQADNRLVAELIYTCTGRKSGI